MHQIGERRERLLDARIHGGGGGGGDVRHHHAHPVRRDGAGDDAHEVRAQLGGVARLAKVADVVDEVEVGDLVLKRLAQLGRAPIVVAIVAARRLAALEDAAGVMGRAGQIRGRAVEVAILVANRRVDAHLGEFGGEAHRLPRVRALALVRGVHALIAVEVRVVGRAGDVDGRVAALDLAQHPMVRADAQHRR